VLTTQTGLNESKQLSTYSSKQNNKQLLFLRRTKMNKMTRGFIAFAVAAQLTITGAATAFAQVDITCVGSRSNQTVQNVIVPMGATFTLTGMRVLGNIEVKELARATVRTSTVSGDIIAEQGSIARLVGGSVAGEVLGLAAQSINVSGGTVIAGGILTEETAAVVVGTGTTAGNIEILKGGTATISGSRVNGSIKFEENRGRVAASSNQVAGNFEAYLNTGGAAFNSNRITGNMQCKDNLPAPTGRGNTAVSKEDQCARL
jgi:hypothetical protein